MIYVIGDLHLSLSTDKPMDKFGEEWKNHHERIKEDWLRKVTEDDIVMLAGDISWAMRYDEALVDFKWIDELPGKKLIIKGNHDYWWNYRSKLAKEFRSIYFINSSCYEYGRYAIVGTRGWDYPSEDDEENKKIYEREKVRLENSLKSVPKNRIIIGMIHYPPSYNGESSAFTDLFEQYGVKKVYYGHLHSKEAFRSAFIGRINEVSYELISCDYTDFKLRLAAEGSKIEVDRTDFYDSSHLLEVRRRGIRMLESGVSVSSVFSEIGGFEKHLGVTAVFDKLAFIDFNFELAKKTSVNFVCDGIDSNDEEEWICDFKTLGQDVFHLFSVMFGEEERRLFALAHCIAGREVLSVADGVIKYNYINALAKWQMSFAERFEFSNLLKCLSLRKIAHKLYELKDKITYGLCLQLLKCNEEIDFYKIYLRSEQLNGKIYEIVSIPSERIILHTMSEYVIRLLKNSGLEELEMQNSKIASYVNKKIY